MIESTPDTPKPHSDRSDPRPRARPLTGPATAALLAVVVIAAATPRPADAEPVHARFVEAELVSNVKAIAPGQPFVVALRLAMDPEWHTYWENPGDTGLPTTLELELPDGFEAGALRFPYPHRFESPPYVSYGYENEVVIRQQITPPADLPTKPLYLEARADWTVCREDLCLPGGADLGIALDVAEAAEPDGYWVNRFAKDAALLPVPLEGWDVVARAAGTKLIVTLTPHVAHDPGSVEAFERERGALDHEHTPAVARDGDAVAITLGLPSKKAPERIDLVLVASRGWSEGGAPRAVVVSAPVAR